MADDLVVVGQFDSYVEAEIARQKLEDAGIKAMVTGDNARNVMGGISAIEEVEVQVLEGDLDKALEVLDSGDGDGYDDDYDDEEDDDDYDDEDDDGYDDDEDEDYDDDDEDDDYGYDDDED